MNVTNLSYMPGNYGGSKEKTGYSHRPYTTWDHESGIMIREKVFDEMLLDELHCDSGFTKLVDILDVRLEKDDLADSLSVIQSKLLWSTFHDLIKGTI